MTDLVLPKSYGLGEMWIRGESTVCLITYIFQTISTTSAFLRTVALNNLTSSRSWTRFVASTYLVCRWKPASRIRSPLIYSKFSCSWEVLHLELLGTRIDGMVVFYKIGLWSLFRDTYYSLELAEAAAALIHEMISSNNRSCTPSFSLCNSWYFPC